ncbi:MAG: CHRD domain-containing protein [Planctomycetota bacterium]
MHSRSFRLLLALAVLVPATTAQVLTTTFPLDGQQEVPPVATTATGSATVTFDLSTMLLSVSGTYSGLSSNQTVAHVHTAPFGSAGTSVVVSLAGTGGTSGSFSGSAPLGSGQFTNGFLRGRMYVNVHSVNFPDVGEIRGQIANLVLPPELVGDPTLSDTGGNPERGPRLGSPLEPFNVALDCSGAGAPGLYAITVHQNTLATPVALAFGRLWFSGARLGLAAGAHTQNSVAYSASGVTLPNDLALLGVSYNVQGICRDPSNPPGRLSAGLIQVIEL